MTKKVLDFELANIALEKFITHQTGVAGLWKGINQTAYENEIFFANLAQIILDKYNMDGNPVRFLMDILDVEEFYRDIIMEFLISEGLAYEIMNLGIDW